jgi:hypothetical protein
VRREKLSIGVSGIAADAELAGKLDLPADAVLSGYWESGAPSDMAMLLRYLLQRYLGEKISGITPPRPKLTKGFVVFGERSDEVRILPDFASWSARVTEREQPRIQRREQQHCSNWPWVIRIRNRVARRPG